MKKFGVHTGTVFWHGNPFSFIPIILEDLGIKDESDVTTEQLVECFKATEALNAYKVLIDRALRKRCKVIFRNKAEQNKYCLNLNHLKPPNGAKPGRT